MTQTILNGVSRKMQLAFINGAISENVLIKQYERNRREAETFSIFGFKMQDIIDAFRATHNPILKARLQQAIEDIKDRQRKGADQNKLSIEKLQNFKESALGVGLRKVINRMRRLCRKHPSCEALLTLTLLEIEFANLAAKMPRISKSTKEYIYERKSILLERIQPLLKECGWRYGYNDANGKNACYIIYVYLPNGVQLSWHTNDYYLYKYYPLIDAEWDGQVCMTMEKLLTYIENKYYQYIKEEPIN